MPNGLEAKTNEEGAAPEAKPRYRSKTYWLAAVVAILGAVAQLDQLAPFIALLPENWGTIAAAIIAALIAVSRELTDKPIKGRILGR